MISLILIYSSIVCVSFFLTLNRFLNNLIILESLNVLVILFCLLCSSLDNHMIFIAFIVVSTIEVIIGLVVLTQIWECSSLLDLADF
uniref:NADH dehydrogenase subunit 4L n=1 Tax=Hydatigena taeniaeformis TaxID=6205 RepID=E4W6A5_HYDTA|nr:NADH dehydrogenase subunit 4L [Hydatigera taeniaeformis]ACN76686.1 NADH dehydrogenase subunit 4L [Hydatigera taeniaeformis]BAV82577.1 NADH dehydrogenase subunit 4L [Hydatigera taeniaeformis]